MAVLWQNVSPFLNSQIRKEDLVLLPSLSVIKSLVSPLVVSLGLSSNTGKYLENRMKALKEREKLVAILIDEVYSAQRVELNNGKVLGIASMLHRKLFFTSV